jgi:hypothetical protein
MDAHGIGKTLKIALMVGAVAVFAFGFGVASLVAWVW